MYLCSFEMKQSVLNMWKLLLSAILLTVFVLCHEAKAQDISVRTNLLWDGLAEPNLGVEFQLSRHFTLGGNVGLKSWPRWLAWDWDVQNPVHWRNFVVAPELRFYFDEFDKKKGKVFEGAFIGSDLVYTHFNVGKVTFPFGLYPQVRDHRLQGDFWGLGIFGGYAWRIKDSRWRVEAEAGVAVGYHKAGKFECDHCGAQVGESRGIVLVPKLGVNLAFDVKRKREEVLEEILPPAPVPEPVPVEFNMPYVEEWRGKAGQLAKQHAVLRPSSDYRPYTPDRILRKEEGALYVFFELGQSQLKRTFTEKDRTRDNGPVLDEIMHITSSIFADSTSAVSRIQIVGLASVEGSQSKNIELARARAQALQTYIQNRLAVPDAVFEIVSGAEAWTEFRDVINDLRLAGGGAGLSQAQLQKVLDILDNETDPTRRERALKALEGGSVYAKLRDNVLADLRNSGYIRVYYDYVPDEKARIINRAIDAIEEGNITLARALAETVKKDSRSAALFDYFQKLDAYEQARKAYENYLEELKQYNLNSKL